jgi:hypothetical protein
VFGTVYDFELKKKNAIPFIVRLIYARMQERNMGFDTDKKTTEELYSSYMTIYSTPHVNIGHERCRRHVVKPLVEEKESAIPLEMGLETQKILKGVKREIPCCQ